MVSLPSMRQATHDQLIRFRTDGPGVLLAIDSIDPRLDQLVESAAAHARGDIRQVVILDIVAPSWLVDSGIQIDGGAAFGLYLDEVAHCTRARLNDRLSHCGTTWNVVTVTESRWAIRKALDILDVRLVAVPRRQRCDRLSSWLIGTSHRRKVATAIL
jgi:hypothetical protein